MHSGERGNPPETFRPAKDRPSTICRAAIGVMFENCPAVLQYEDRTAASALGILCRTCAIGWPDLGKRSSRRCGEKRKRNTQPVRKCRPRRAHATPEF